MHHITNLRKGIFSKILTPMLLLCTGCQVGLGLPQANLSQQEAQITPRTKGPTLSITPRTKGSTLLNGSVIWPDDIKPPSSLSFEIQSIGENNKTSIVTAHDGSFSLILQANTQVRIEAKAIFDPELVFKTIVQVPETDEAVPIKISLESTAIVALMDHALQAQSTLQNMPMESYERPEIMPKINEIKERMKPFLSTNMQSNLESMPNVQEAMNNVHQELVDFYQKHPEMRP